MKRWHEEADLLARLQRLDTAHGRTNELGQYRKRKPLDCGNTRCGICHSDKFPKRQTTRQESRSDLKWAEQLKEWRSGLAGPEGPVFFK